MTEVGDVGELDRVVDAREDGLAEVEPDLVGVDVEGSNELNVADVVAAELDVQEPGHQLVRVGLAIELDTMHEAARAVADADDRDADLAVAAAAGARPRVGRLRALFRAAAVGACHFVIHSCFVGVLTR